MARNGWENVIKSRHEGLNVSRRCESFEAPRQNVQDESEQDIKWVICVMIYNFDCTMIHCLVFVAPKNQQKLLLSHLRSGITKYEASESFCLCIEKLFTQSKLSKLHNYNWKLRLNHELLGSPQGVIVYHQQTNLISPRCVILLFFALEKMGWIQHLFTIFSFLSPTFELLRESYFHQFFTYENHYRRREPWKCSEKVNVCKSRPSVK